MKKKIIFCLTAILCVCYQVFADNITLLKAAKNGSVSVVARAKGGYFGECLGLKIANKTAKRIEVKIEAGTIFTSEKDWQQDLVVLEEIILVLLPKVTEWVGVTTACIEAGNASPAAESAFVLSHLASSYLLQVVKIINEYKYREGTAQSAVWASIKPEGEKQLYGTNAEVLKKLCAVLSQATGKPCKEVINKPLVLTYLNGSLQCLVPQHLKNASLKMYDRRGNLVRTYLENKQYKPGFYQLRIGHPHYEADTSTFVLQLEENGKVISKKIITKNDTIPQLWEKQKQTYIDYNLPRDVKAARIGLYDAQDNLYFLVADDYPLKKGMHRTEIKFNSPLPLGIDYFIKIKENNVTVAQQNIPLDEQNKPQHKPIVARGTFKCTLPETVKGSLTAYDAAGNFIWTIYEDSKFVAGNKTLTYSFLHRLGAEANITLRLTDGTGKIWCEQVVKGK